MAAVSLFDRRLVIVTGKGGVGKSVVAMAAAVAAAARGRRTLLVDLTESGTLSDRLALARPLGSSPRRVRSNLSACKLEPREALEHFVRGLMPFGFLARRLLGSQSFQTVAAAAPGIDEFLALYRISQWEAEKRPGTGRSKYDLIVIDAPATGHSLPLLSAPDTFLKMVPLGPFADMSRRLGKLVGNAAKTTIAVVAIPEEMAVNEASELHNHLDRELRLPVAPPIVNAVPPRRLAADEEAWIEDTTNLPSPWLPYVQAARFELARHRAAVGHIRTLEERTGASPVCLPYVFAPAITVETASPIIDALARAGGEPQRVTSSPTR